MGAATSLISMFGQMSMQERRQEFEREKMAQEQALAKKLIADQKRDFNQYMKPIIAENPIVESNRGAPDFDPRRHYNARIERADRTRAMANNNYATMQFADQYDSGKITPPKLNKPQYYDGPQGRMEFNPNIGQTGMTQQIGQGYKPNMATVGANDRQMMYNKNAPANQALRDVGAVNQGSQSSNRNPVMDDFNKFRMKEQYKDDRKSGEKYISQTTNIDEGINAAKRMLELSFGDDSGYVGPGQSGVALGQSLLGMATGSDAIQRKAANSQNIEREGAEIKGKIVASINEGMGVLSDSDRKAFQKASANNDWTREALERYIEIAETKKSEYAAIGEQNATTGANPHIARWYSEQKANREALAAANSAAQARKQNAATTAKAQQDRLQMNSNIQGQQPETPPAVTEDMKAKGIPPGTPYRIVDGKILYWRD